MPCIDKLFLFLVGDISRADIHVKLGIGKAEIFLVGLSAKSVDGSFVNKQVGKFPLSP